ncbi:MAG: hypothetical protein ACPGVP_07545 [Thiolinea sp.]
MSNGLYFPNPASAYYQSLFNGRQTTNELTIDKENVIYKHMKKDVVSVTVNIDPVCFHA